jgi:hypothetical protein
MKDKVLVHGKPFLLFTGKAGSLPRWQLLYDHAGKASRVELVNEGDND